MMQGSDINLEISKIICTIYQIPWTRFIHINYFASTNNQSKQFSDELDTIDSSQVDPSNGNEVYLIPETCNNSLIQKGAT